MDSYRLKSKDERPHAHMFTLRTGQTAVSSVDSGDPHSHVVAGELTSKSSGEGHVHTVEIRGITITSGPPLDEAQVKMDAIQKGLLPELVDPNHVYVFRTGDFGLYDYWYIDQAGNYWKYTNAPEDDPDHEDRFGIPVMIQDQPMPHTAPAFFTVEGRKRHVAVPKGLVPQRNEEYSPLDPRKIWYEVYQAEDQQIRYVYLDADIRENLDLWVQYQLRVTAAALANYRKYAAELFSLNHPKDRLVGALLILMDQGLYDLDELINAAVGDLSFIGNTVKLLGRKFNCDATFLDFLTSLVADRELTSPLFELDTYHGRNPIGRFYLASVTKQLRVNPRFLHAWHASRMFSEIVHRLLAERVPFESVESQAFSELKQIFNTRTEVRYLVDYKVRETILANYEEQSSSVDEGPPQMDIEDEAVEKALPRVHADDFGVGLIYSNLDQLSALELEFAEWLHAEPLHVTVPAEEAEVESMLEEASATEEEEQGASGEGTPGAEGGGGVPGGRPETAAPGPEA